jgi:hypothetical protein
MGVLLSPQNQENHTPHAAGHPGQLGPKELTVPLRRAGTLKLFYLGKGQEDKVVTM